MDEMPVLRFEKEGLFHEEDWGVTIRRGEHPELQPGVEFDLQYPEGTRRAKVRARERLPLAYVPEEMLKRARIPAGSDPLETLHRIPGYEDLELDDEVTVIEYDLLAPA